MSILDPIMSITAPYASQPFKAFYMAFIVLSTLLLLPCWTVMHFAGLLPFPRSYTLKESLVTRTMQRMEYIVVNCGYHIDVMDHFQLDLDSLNKTFKHTRMQWITPPPNEDKWYKGVATGCLPATIPATQWLKNGKPTADLVIAPDQLVCLNLHGGGLAMGNSTENDITAGERHYPRCRMGVPTTHPLVLIRRVLAAASQCLTQAPLRLDTGLSQSQHGCVPYATSRHHHSIRLPCRHPQGIPQKHYLVRR
jgi:hypothetical protein